MQHCAERPFLRSTVVSTSNGRYATAGDIERVLARGVAAQRAWRNVPVAERARIVQAFANAFEKRRDSNR